MDRSQNYALHFICITFKNSAMSAQNCFYFMKCKCNIESLVQPVFRIFEQLLPCQVTILQHLQDVAKALRKLKQRLY